MCWTGPVSTGMATIGFGGAIVALLLMIYIPFVNNWIETPLRENELNKKK